LGGSYWLGHTLTDELDDQDLVSNFDRYGGFDNLRQVVEKALAAARDNCSRMRRSHMPERSEDRVPLSKVNAVRRALGLANQEEEVVVDQEVEVNLTMAACLHR
jgi:chromatin segregation and condensation protein Rec8/ScpA/Scc1 (kleisin family)